MWWCSPAFHVVLSKDDHVDIVGGDKIGCSKDGEEDARILVKSHLFLFLKKRGGLMYNF